MELIIEYENRRYEIKEPTIEQWAKIIGLKDIESEEVNAIKMISILTGLSMDEIREVELSSIENASSAIYDMIMNQENKFHEFIIHNNKKYQFIDLKNIKFGEYVDLDSFLSRPLSYRMQNLHEFMALVYKELDDKGNPKKFKLTEFTEKVEEFKSLPVKYVNGALVFFWTIEKVLSENIKIYFLAKIRWTIIRWIQKRKIMKSPSVSFGAGMQRLINYLTMIFQKIKRY